MPRVLVQRVMAGRQARFERMRPHDVSSLLRLILLQTPLIRYVLSRES
jgi:hypothetical protein